MEDEDEDGTAPEGDGQAEAAAQTRTRRSLMDLINGKYAVLSHQAVYAQEGTLAEAFAVDGILTRPQLIGLLRGQDLGRILFADDDDDDGDVNARYERRRRLRNREPLDPNRFPKVPSEEGHKLMDSGAFGSSASSLDARKRLARRILEREMGVGGRHAQRTSRSLMAQASTCLLTAL
jgi:hypothetical protein